MVPLITGSIPLATGPYPISYAYVRSPPLIPYTRPYPRYRSTSKPALEIRETAYSIFYPAAKASSRHSGRIPWLPDPAETSKGYDKFVGSTWASWALAAMRPFASRIRVSLTRGGEKPKLTRKIPVHALDTPSVPSNAQDKWPLVIFSHGLAGTRHTYSHYCAALASEGYVVLSLEHRDGSGPAVILPFAGGLPGEKEVKYYMKMDELEFEGQKEHKLLDLRTLQLDVRLREVYEAYASFKKLCAANTPDTTHVGDLPSEHRSTWIESWKDKVDMDHLTLAGHSFGGGTVFHLLQNEPPDGFGPLPVSRAIALDPWVEPIPAPAASSKANPMMPPMLVINSVGFTDWPPHFGRLLGMVREAKGSFMTLLGASHQTFSDIPLLASRAALPLLKTIDALSVSFLRSELSASPLLEGKTPDNGKLEEGWQKGKSGDILLHLLGD